jgi:acyl-CoA reductase-like NAD-dependent aldehyde dehydrogenase
VAAAPKSPAGKAAPAASAPPSGTAAADPDERHPQIRSALASLRNAREHLQHASHDFGGHRVDAIKAIDEAIRQLEICMEYDKH